MDDPLRRPLRRRRAAFYPGSLNLVLDDPWPLPCSVRGRRCFIFRTDLAEQTGGDEHRTLEILAAVCLRDDLGLTDGDKVEVIV